MISRLVYAPAGPSSRFKRSAISEGYSGSVASPRIRMMCSSRLGIVDHTARFNSPHFRQKHLNSGFPGLAVCPHFSQRNHPSRRGTIGLKPSLATQYGQRTACSAILNLPFRRVTRTCFIDSIEHASYDPLKVRSSPRTLRTPEGARGRHSHMVPPFPGSSNSLTGVLQLAGFNN